MLTTQIIKAFSISLLVALVMGCSTSQPKSFNTNALPLTTTEMKHRSLLMEAYDNWKGVPYLYGGQTRQGVDCSALVQTFFKQNFAYHLPRTTRTQSEVGHSITPFDKKEVGDLLFFKITRKSRHVGIYIGYQQFIHASQSKGVIISRLDNPYWSSKLWQIRRVSISASVTD